MSYRLNALKRLTDFLKLVTVANGYSHDLSANVFRGRSVYGANDPLPLLSILESPRSDIGSYAGETERKEGLGLLIQGWVYDDVNNPTDPAYLLMDDVERHLDRILACSQSNGQPLFPEDYLLGKTIANIKVHPGVVRPPMEGVSSKAFFYLPVTLTLVK